MARWRFADSLATARPHMRKSRGKMLPIRGHPPAYLAIVFPDLVCSGATAQPDIQRHGSQTSLISWRPLARGRREIRRFYSQIPPPPGQAESSEKVGAAYSPMAHSPVYPREPVCSGPTAYLATASPDAVSSGPAARKGPPKYVATSQPGIAYILAAASQGPAVHPSAQVGEMFRDLAPVYVQAVYSPGNFPGNWPPAPSRASVLGESASQFARARPRGRRLCGQVLSDPWRSLADATHPAIRYPDLVPLRAAVCWGPPAEPAISQQDMVYLGEAVRGRPLKHLPI